jgi:3-methyladenine DNA glycosylase AlkD
MKTGQARDVGARIANLVAAGETEQAYALLSPVLNKRTPFDKLRLIGWPIGEAPQADTDPFIYRIATDRTEGGWVVIASILEKQLGRDLPGTLSRCRENMLAGDVWYCCDILAEGVAGNALVSMFDEALEQLEPWRTDEDPWVRRAFGIGAHYWAKRSQGNEPAKAAELLQLLKPMFEERVMQAVKGIGWGLKTLGRYYPDLMSDWLTVLVLQEKRPHRVIMLRKACTYLPDEQRGLFENA